MNVVDAVLLGLGLFFILRGIMKGLSGEIISLVGTVGGFVCAIRFYEPFADILARKFGATALVSTILSMLAIFSLIFFGSAMLEMSIKKIISKTRLTFTDKLLGAFVGLLKLYFISLTVLIGGGIIAPMTGDAWMRESRVLAISAVTWPFAGPMLEKAGLLPNVAAIQEEARGYITRQAGRALIGTSGDLTPGTGSQGIGGIGGILGLGGAQAPAATSGDEAASGDTAP
jgi:membrane protein required for colicin V production